MNFAPLSSGGVCNLRTSSVGFRCFRSNALIHKKPAHHHTLHQFNNSRTILNVKICLLPVQKQSWIRLVSKNRKIDVTDEPQYNARFSSPSHHSLGNTTGFKLVSWSAKTWRKTKPYIFFKFLCKTIHLKKFYEHIKIKKHLPH